MQIARRLSILSILSMLRLAAESSGTSKERLIKLTLQFGSRMKVTTAEVEEVLNMSVSDALGGIK